MLRFAVTQLMRLLVYSAIGALLAVVIGYAWYVNKLPDLHVWQTARLDEEFRAADADRVRTLADYLDLEDRLFRQLDLQVYAEVPPGERTLLNRYSAGSRADPRAQRPDWNRTVLLEVDKPRGGVLLLHGLSDSPYSMRALAEHFQQQGLASVALRIPGHGTAPSGLLRTTWRDMAAAVRLAARDLASRLPPGAPLYLVGYSNGAALAVEYALARLEGEDLPEVRGLILLSPAIGVSPAAALAVWQSRIATWLDAPKVAWNELLPEYDPYKYGSFTVNAADLVYGLTENIRQRLERLGKDGPVAGVPPILAFSSVADATVSTPAVIDTLFRKLAPGRHSLVLFDINRYAAYATLMDPPPLRVKADLLEGPALAFDVSIVGNASPDTLGVAVFNRPAGAPVGPAQATGLEWPPEVYSLSHVALPFAPSDPVYGEQRPVDQKLVFLGQLDLSGEKGLLVIPPAALIRLRHNPFMSYLLERVDAFTGN
jgi:alpha-beta hydrolase superfamily lysophospholipase